MESENLFRIVLGVLFFVAYIPRRYYQEVSRRTIAEGLLEDRDSRWDFIVPTALYTFANLAIIAYLINPLWVSFAALDLPLWLRWAGAVLGIIGVPLFLWTHRVLGNNFFGGMKLRPGHTIVREGPYRWIRHPMYVAFILLGLSHFLLSASLLIGVPWLVATSYVLRSRMVGEEKMMIQHFGDAYREYQEQTGRFLPKIRILN